MPNVTGNDYRLEQSTLNIIDNYHIQNVQQRWNIAKMVAQLHICFTTRQVYVRPYTFTFLMEEVHFINLWLNILKKNPI